MGRGGIIYSLLYVEVDGVIGHFTFRPLYLREKNLQYHLNRRLVGPQTDLGASEKRCLLSVFGVEPRFVGRLASCLVTVPTTLHNELAQSL